MCNVREAEAKTAALEIAIACQKRNLEPMLIHRADHGVNTLLGRTSNGRSKYL